MSHRLLRRLALGLALGLVLFPSALAAQAVSIGVNQIGVDVVVTLTDDEGRRVGTALYGPARGLEAFSTAISTGGIYTLHVAPSEQEEGDFEIQILHLEARSDNPERLADPLMFPCARPGGPGGAIQVWRGGRTVFSRAYGLA